MEVAEQRSIPSIKESKTIPLLALCVGFFMVMIDVTVVNVALPSMAIYFNSGISGLQWVVDGYALTFACLLLSAGNLSDRVGAKNIFLSGLILFVLTSIGCGIAYRLWWLVVCRILQGVAAALVVPTSLTLIKSSYESKKDQAKAIGIWGGIGGIAAAFGPVLGALLTAGFSWKAVFYINIPIGIAGILLTYKFVSRTHTHRKGEFDLFGQILGIISVAALAFGLIEAGRLGWLSEEIIISFITFLVAFIAFLIIENRTSSPLFPLKLFRIPTFTASIIVGMVLNIGFYGNLFILPLYFQGLRRYSVFLTGLAILPQPGLAAVASYLGGRMASITGPKSPMIIGLLIGSSGFLAMLIVKDHAPSYFQLILPLAAIGFGTAFTMPATTIAIIHSVPENRVGIASGAFNASRQVGSLIGVAVFGTIIAVSTKFIFGMHITLIVGGIVFLLGCMVTMLLVNKKTF